MPALHIITGDVNTGKTARMRDLFRYAHAADGLLSEKLYENGCFRGYRLVCLRSGKAMELALQEAAYHGQYEEACRMGPYVFSAEAFHFGRQVLEQLCADTDTATVFLDEAGPLELADQGFAGVLPVLLQAEKELYMTVRSGCLQEFIRKYGIREYRLIHVPPCRESPGS